MNGPSRCVPAVAPRRSTLVACLGGLLVGGASLALPLGRRDEGEPVPLPDAPPPVAPPASDPVAPPPERAEVAVAPEAARAFLAWAAENWSDPARATPEPTCYGPKDPDHGWCEGMVLDGSLVRGVK